MSQSEVNKKKCEEHYLREFLKARGLRADVTMREEPDAILSLNTEREIGVELTVHQQGSSGEAGGQLRAFESLWKKLWKQIKTEATNHPQAEALKMMLARVSFRRHNLPTRRIPTLVTELVELQASRLEEVSKSGNCEIDSFDHYPALADFVRKVWFVRSPKSSASYWTCQELSCGAVGINRDHLLDVLREKRNKVAKYRDNIGNADLWLLIHLEMSPYLSSFPPPEYLVKRFAEDNRAMLEQCGFDEIWFHDSFEGKAHRLFPSSPCE